MPRQDATEVLQPREPAFDLPAPFVATQRPPVLGLHAPVAAVRSDQLDTFLCEVLRERVAVVGLVADEARRCFGEEAGIQGGLDQRDLSWRSTGHVDRDRKTRTVCHCHDLRTFAPFSGAHTKPPFFATTKVASTKHSDKSSLPRLRRSSASAVRMRLKTPARDHSWCRRWQVAGDGYRSGTSRQCAPVRRIQDRKSVV